MSCAIIVDLINAHLLAVHADEATFDAAGQPLDEAEAARTWAAEITAFKAFCAAQCGDLKDVQMKLNYLLNGAVAERNKLTECLLMEEYGGPDLLETVLRSLQVGPVENLRSIQNGKGEQWPCQISIR